MFSFRLATALIVGTTFFVGLPVSSPERITTPAAKQVMFDVASVKPNLHAGGARGGCHGIDTTLGVGPLGAIPLGRCVITGARLSHLIILAYGIPQGPPPRGGPDWVSEGNDRFDINAASADPSTTTAEQLATMLQNLIAERFRLTFHRARSSEPGFALVVAKAGHRLKKASGNERSQMLGSGGKGGKSMLANSPLGRNADPSVNANRRAPGDPSRLILFDARNYTMLQFAVFLSQTGIGPVVDETHISGGFDFKLSFEPDELITEPLEKQLGLRLEKRFVMVEQIVIDSAEKPAGN